MCESVQTRVDPQHIACKTVAIVTGTGGATHTVAATAGGALTPGTTVKHIALDPRRPADSTTPIGSCPRWCRGSCLAARASGGATGCARSSRWRATTLSLEASGQRTGSVHLAERLCSFTSSTQRAFHGERAGRSDGGGSAGGCESRDT